MTQTIKLGDIVYMSDMYKHEPDYWKKEEYIERIYVVKSINTSVKGGIAALADLQQGVPEITFSRSLMWMSEALTQNYNIILLCPVFGDDSGYERAYYLSQLKLEVINNQ